MNQFYEQELPDISRHDLDSSKDQINNKPKQRSGAAVVATNNVVVAEKKRH